MIYRNLTLFSLLFFSSLTTFAQTKGSYLENALAVAQKELAEVDSLIGVEKNKLGSYDVCTMNEYFARQRSAKWFVDHYSDFEALSKKIDTVVTEANAKIESLGSESVAVIPVEKQASNAAEVKITLSSMIEYFKVYNARMESCKKDLQPELQRQMEDPRRNSLNLAHSQVVSAMKIMTTNLNASLKDTDTRYELTFGQAESGYQLELKVSLDFNETKQEYKFSLLSVDSQATKVQLSDEAMWSDLIARNGTIDGYPIDALKRLAIILNEERGGCEKIPVISKAAVAETVYDTYSNLLKVRKKMLADHITLSNGNIANCEDLNGVFVTPEGNTIEITDACHQRNVRVSGGGWEGQGKKHVSWRNGVIRMKWKSGYHLRFTPRDLNTFDYQNLKRRGTNVFTRVK